MDVARTPFRASFDDRFEPDSGVVDVPVRVEVLHGERGLPWSDAARTYRDIRSWEELAAGRHFAAWRNPDEVVAGLVDLGREVL